jgi:hypothetical protein
MTTPEDDEQEESPEDRANREDMENKLNIVLGDEVDSTDEEIT